MTTFAHLKLGRIAFLFALLAMPVASHAQATATPKAAAPAVRVRAHRESSAARAGTAGAAGHGGSGR